MIVDDTRHGMNSLPCKDRGSVGANPTGQGSLQPEAVGAVRGGNESR